MTELKLTNKGLPVGLLFSFNSLTSAVETTQHQATLLAIDEINSQGGVNGTPLAPVTADIGPDPTDYQSVARQLCNEHDVRILFGTHMSNQRKAALPTIEKRDALLFYPTLYEGFEYSSNCIYTGAAPNQNSVQLARYVLKNHGNRILFVGNNYVFAHESNRIMRDLFEEAGASVVDETYLPLNSPDDQIESVIRRAIMLAPDAIYSTVVGADTIKLYEAFARSPLRNTGIPIVSLATNEADLSQMSSEAAEGHISAAPYFQSLQSPVSKAFVQRYLSRFGDGSPITAGAEAAYFQVHLFAKAARLAGELQLPTILEAFGTARYDAPQGQVRIDTATHHTYLWPRIARVDANKNFIIIEEEQGAVRPEPYMIQHTFEKNVAQNA
ncbi:transporter substrate-binding domain-containing protein [Hoeflea sp. E7-10]|uniref:Transporter substrate-binding domain-containing protein n=2 Tax=Hoeflea poritis TaxID=2993659 RepID=A0ABT4VWW0_9HYPH|nr:transporter substrate-binding domain-containing protein [Hoeflea poritis]MDA4848700.1 transporter substrate-binding domain-containing protein [Hoeflea poritis]